MLPKPSVPDTAKGLFGLLIGVPPDKNVTMPPGARPPLVVWIVALNLTASVVSILVLSLVNEIVVGALVTVIVVGDELLALKLASPL
jgi:hypothetical protein